MEERRGFTLIEIITGIGIMSLLLGLVISGLLSLRNNTGVSEVSNQVLSALQLANSKSVASFEDSSYGVHFDTDKYVIFKGSSYNASDSDNENHPLSNTMEFYNINLNGGGSDVIYNTLLGTTDEYGAVSVRNVQDQNNNRTINVLASGQSGIFGSVNPIDSRLDDTRHTHFDLQYSILDKTTLSLDFDDSPGVQEDITLADYYDVGQTVFDWEGTVDVNGDSQTIRVHTHSISAGATELCIHRDQRFNDIGVTVLFDGSDEIVIYDADGTATVKPFGGTMAQQ